MEYWVESYYDPQGYVGIGKDIKWCNKWHGGKNCLLCRHYADYSDWTKTWNFFYLMRWGDHYGRNFAHQKYSWKWGHEGYVPTPYYIKPVRYRTPGLKDREFKNLIKKGCKPKRKCTCMSLVQRGNWFCPECWGSLIKLSKYKGSGIHDLIVNIDDEIKSEILIMKLSGLYD